MIEGPYKSNRWRERLAEFEGVLLLLQTLALIVVLAVFGFDWLAGGHYLRFCLVYGSGTALLYAYRKTRAPLFLVAFGLLCVVAGILYGD